MKEVRIKLFTVIGLLTVILLQTSWLYNTYSLIKRNIEEQSNVLILDATEREFLVRFNLIVDKIPEGTLLSSDEITETGEAASTVF